MFYVTKCNRLVHLFNFIVKQVCVFGKTWVTITSVQIEFLRATAASFWLKGMEGVGCLTDSLLHVSLTLPYKAYDVRESYGPTTHSMAQADPA